MQPPQLVPQHQLLLQLVFHRLLSRLLLQLVREGGVLPCQQILILLLRILLPRQVQNQQELRVQLTRRQNRQNQVFIHQVCIQYIFCEKRFF